MKNFNTWEYIYIFNNKRDRWFIIFWNSDKTLWKFDIFFIIMEYFHIFPIQNLRIHPNKFQINFKLISNFVLSFFQIIYVIVNIHVYIVLECFHISSNSNLKIQLNKFQINIKFCKVFSIKLLILDFDCFKRWITFSILIKCWIQTKKSKSNNSSYQISQ